MANILIIDDQPIFLSVLEQFLQARGHTVHKASEGRIALAMVCAGGIDLVLSDIDMPGMSGIVLCEKLKANPLWSRIPILLMTGRPSPATTVCALVAGAEMVLAKPFAFGELQAALERYLSRGCPDTSVYN